MFDRQTITTLKAWNILEKLSIFFQKISATGLKMKRHGHALLIEDGKKMPEIVISLLTNLANIHIT